VATARTKQEEAEVQSSAFADLDAEFADTQNDIWKREEQKTLAQIVELETVAMPAQLLEARQIDADSDEFKQAYGADGLPCLMIGLKGIDVDYAYAEDHIRRIYIPLMGDRPGKFGERKGRRSQSHIVAEAFVEVFKVRPFGTENRERIIGAKVLWGQHLGEATIDDEKREWAWDVPRRRLPDDFEYDGQVRILEARDGGNTSGASSAGTEQMSDEDAEASILGAIVGLNKDDVSGASAKVYDIAGLPSEWYSAAAQDTVFVLAHEKGLIGVDDDGNVIAAQGG
jgi:hypothetical protein